MKHVRCDSAMVMRGGGLIEVEESEKVEEEEKRESLWRSAMVRQEVRGKEMRAVRCGEESDGLMVLSTAVLQEASMPPQK